MDTIRKILSSRYPILESYSRLNPLHTDHEDYFRIWEFNKKKFIYRITYKVDKFDKLEVFELFDDQNISILIDKDNITLYMNFRDNKQIELLINLVKDEGLVYNLEIFLNDLFPPQISFYT
jgi:hypothetical protein